VKLEIFIVSIKLVLVHVAFLLTRVQDNTTCNKAFGRRDHFDGRLTNSGTILIFR